MLVSVRKLKFSSVLQSTLRTRLLCLKTGASESDIINIKYKIKKLCDVLLFNFLVYGIILFSYFIVFLV